MCAPAVHGTVCLQVSLYMRLLAFVRMRTMTFLLCSCVLTLCDRFHVSECRLIVVNAAIMCLQFRDLKDILRFLDSVAAAGNDWVVSRYIERPLLLRGNRKFDIRTWVLLDTNYNVYLYRCVVPVFLFAVIVAPSISTVLCTGMAIRHIVIVSSSCSPCCVSRRCVCLRIPVVCVCFKL